MQTLDLSRRATIPEVMDDPDVEATGLAGALRYLAWTNERLGGTRILLDVLARELGRRPPREELGILDVGTGGADVPRALLRWSESRLRHVWAAGLDLHARTIELARHGSADSLRVLLVRGDARTLPFGDRRFDYAVSTTFLHHLDDKEARDCLAEMNRVARLGVIVVDLVRTLPAYVGIRLLTLLTGNRLTRHDGPVSVRRAFTAQELFGLAASAGLPGPRVLRRFPFRLVLVTTR